MISDLRSILEDWDYEPGKISVRKIIGRDGNEKIQTRVDLGLLQFEPEGRPDGQRPHGFDSLLDFHENRLIEHVRQRGTDEDFSLSDEDCRELRHEGYLYYQRYLSLFVLEEYNHVERDTARNLRLMDFCNRYAVEEADRNVLEPQRPYVSMMHARALAHQALDAGDEDAALLLVDDGLRQVEMLLESSSDSSSVSERSEIRLLLGLRDRILHEMPDDARVKLEQRLDAAIAAEDYETAARLRDQLSEQAPAQHAAHTAAPDVRD
ncbi:MAG: UvrB/UvrC motif-containing protein [Phycisphaerae bacterium]|nr:UvrB/UvrC motif-containing protein [Phycisphaerae bacterium]